MATTQVPAKPLREAMEGSNLNLQTPQDDQRLSTTTSSSTPFTQVSIGGSTRTAEQPDSQLQEQLTLANQLPEQDSPEESCKVQASDSLPTPA
ncbi:hypothetical protein PO909_014595 [Leuciscus waleckii]